jgi:hypothetical protein
MSKPQQTYWQKLRDPRWQKKRLEIMQRDEFMCQNCFDKSTTLNVHHKIYTKGCEPWEYDDDNYITLCEPCHKSSHELIDDIKNRIYSPFMYDVFYELINNEYYDEFCTSALMYAQQYHNPERREFYNNRLRQSMQYLIERIDQSRKESINE